MSAIPAGLAPWLEHNERSTNTEPFVELDLESQIDWNAHLMHSAKTREERMAAEDRVRKLIAMRTPERVEEIERARGLR